MYWNDRLYTLDVYDLQGNLIKELDRFEKLDDARKPRRAEHVLMLRLKAMILRRSDDPSETCAALDFCNAHLTLSPVSLLAFSVLIMES